MVCRQTPRNIVRNISKEDRLSFGPDCNQQVNVVCVPKLEGAPRRALCTGNHCGGGEGVVDFVRSNWIWRLGRCSSSSMKTMELCRPLISLENDGRWAASSSTELHRPLISSDNDSRCAVSSASSMNFLVEGRPFGADAPAGVRTSDAFGEAVLLSS